MYCKLGAVARTDVLASTWYAEVARVFDDHVGQYSFVEIGHEIFFMALFFPNADSVTDERNWLTARHDHCC